ncbi:hypothetical protein [Asanoa sp. NPDC050611]|uniref:hypothetical protein n=1 Tax=Asanoa sp. NPDC050611 TaxID=3157098 RepID=UPI0033EB4CCE
MPRASSSITVVLGVVAAALGAGFGTAWAAPSPGTGGAGAAAPVQGKKVCTVDDSKLVELSGLVATKTGFVVINDSSDVSSRERVFFLNRKCELTDSVSYPGGGPRDTEDLALSPDGKTLWVADTGNNITSDDKRESIVLWSLPVNGSKEPTLHRFVYPDTKPRDAEALVMTGTGAGTPMVITKSTGPAELFVPAAAIKSDNSTGVRMKKVGTVTLPKTETPNLLGAAGRVTVTGAARSPNGAKVVVRTYADAFEWDVTDGDVAGALTGGTAPRVTGLTDPFGEAISYTADGKQFVTVSDGGQLGEDEEIQILSYAPAAAPVPAAASPGAGGGKGDDGKSFLDGLTLKDITSLIAAIGVIGLILVGAGVAGIIVARKKKAAAGSGEPAVGAGTARVGRQVAPDWDQDGSGNVYGGAPAPTPGGGGVYGAGSRGGGGGVYGGGGQRQPSGGGGGVYGGGSPGYGDGPPAQGERPRGTSYGRQRQAPDDYGYSGSGQPYGQQHGGPDGGYGGNGYVGSGQDYRG